MNNKTVLSHMDDNVPNGSRRAIDPLAVGVRLAQLNTVCRNVPDSALTGVLAACVMALLLRDIVSPMLLTVWFVSVVLSNGLRVVLCRLQDQAFGHAPDELALAVRWESWHALAASVAGLAWGALPLLLPIVQPVFEFIVALVVSALAINSLGVYGGGRSMYYFFGLPVLLGQTAAFFFQPSVHAMPMLLAWLLASLVLLVYARHNRDALSKGLAGRVALRVLQSDYSALFSTVPAGVLMLRQGII